MKRGTQQPGFPLLRFTRPQGARRRTRQTGFPFDIAIHASAKNATSGSSLRRPRLQMSRDVAYVQDSWVPENRALATPPVFLMVAPIISYANISNM